jgi:phosphohistidine phosphatase
MHDLSDEYVQVLIVGHNPGLEELVEILTGEIHLTSTCSLADVNLRVDKWLERDYEITGQLEEIWLPRDLTKSYFEKSALFSMFIHLHLHQYVK